MSLIKSSSGVVAASFAEPAQHFDGQALSAATRDAVRTLAADAAQRGFVLGVASGWRSFARQLRIWNAKACGERPLLDDAGQPLDYRQLSAEECMWAILRWSALPGGSRHHWGSDLDVFDRAAMPANYQLQLTREETQSGGVFAAFHQWLDDYLQQADCPFFRPYTALYGGVAPEPWHLSYAPEAAALQQTLEPDSLKALIMETDIRLKAPILEHFDRIFANYIWVDWAQYPAAYRPAGA